MDKAPLTLISFARPGVDMEVQSVLRSLGYEARMGSASSGVQQDQKSGMLVVLLGSGSGNRERVLSALAHTPAAPSLALMVEGEGGWDAGVMDRCCDCAQWPCAGEELAYRLGRLCQGWKPRDRLDPEPLLEETLAGLNLIGRSTPFLAVMDQLRRMVACEAPVLIKGETGTGKELVARALHYLGERSGGPFVPVNCGALPDHLVENELFGHERGAYTDAGSSAPGAIGEAAGGTLFLDEVEALSPRAQAALLRFLQDREYRPLGARRGRRADTRVIAASNADLKTLCVERTFRADLYFRLDILSLTLPPLRARGGDITHLAQHFIDRYAHQYGRPAVGLDPRCRPLMQAYAWPGNVRELENLVHREVLLSDGQRILLNPGREAPPAATAWPAPADLSNSFAEAKARAIETFERDYLTRLMDATGGNVTQAARRAAKERRALGKLLKKHRIPTSRDG
jgi:DNA-binding NtrC family response regulator